MLQGTLEDFSLDEVLGLLSSTEKSGRLRLSGNRGTGSLWLDDGSLTAAEASKIPGNKDIEDVMFEMLRFDDGTFSFMVDDVPNEEFGPEEVAAIVDNATLRLTEWRLIEEVVPSLSHVVSLSADLPESEVSITDIEWKTIVAIGEHTAVEPVCEQLGLDEVDGSRQIKQMIDRGLLEIAEPSPASVSQETDQRAAAVAKAVETATAANSGETKSSERPPMPPPPSPAEIASFSADLAETSPFQSSEFEEEALVGADDDGGSVLMKYLQGDN